MYEPVLYKEEDFIKWRQVMEKKIQSLYQNKTESKKVVDNRWMSNVKRKTDRNVDRYSH